jgi:hypothetical protein
MPVISDNSVTLIENDQKWFIRFTPMCFILASDKIKIVFDYPNNKLPIYTEETDFDENGSIINGSFKTELYTMYITATDNIMNSVESGSIDMVGMLVDKLLPSFTFPIPFNVARYIQIMGSGTKI